MNDASSNSINANIKTLFENHNIPFKNCLSFMSDRGSNMQNKRELGK